MFNDKIYIHGGHHSKDGKLNKHLDDLWIYSTKDQAWSKPDTTGVNSKETSSKIKPSARASHTFNRVKRKFYLFGGTNGKQNNNEMWVLDTDNNQWNELRKS